MKNLKKITTKKTVLVLAFILALILLYLINAFIPDKSANYICNQIYDLQKSNSNFIIYIERYGSSIEDNEIFYELNEKHNDVKVIKILYSKIDSECLKSLLVKNNIYNSIKNDTSSNFFILYKSDTYSGLYINATNYDQLEEYLIERGITENPKIKETITFNEFKNAIKEEYLLFLITDEEHRSMIIPHAKKVFSNYKYDIINIKSDEGSKIYKYINNNFKTYDLFPQAIYFKNNKPAGYGRASNYEIDYVEFKNDITKK